MEGISNILGEGETKITIGGKAYTLSAQNLDDLAEREAYILSLKPNPLEVLETLPPLPLPPEIPVPPDAKEGPQAAQEYSKVLARYQSEKRQHDQLVVQRARMEDRAWKMATGPKFVSFEEDVAFDNSQHGLGYRFWRLLRNHHPEIDSIQKAINLIMLNGNLEQVVEVIDQAEEKDLVGNFDGLEGATAGRDVSHGGNSAQTSQKSTDGLPKQSVN